jgi:hypothetical protein
MKINSKMLQLVLISFITGIFIYYRKLDYYKSIPRLNLLASLLIMLWTFLAIAISPWFIILGLAILNIYGIKHEF